MKLLIPFLVSICLIGGCINCTRTQFDRSTTSGWIVKSMRVKESYRYKGRIKPERYFLTIEGRSRQHRSFSKDVEVSEAYFRSTAVGVAYP